ncbi:programmed cell death protein 2 [Multifurca ochricompacta]|uniref:Programmed cell death protein 2 n=1 Tax=Multifurca ochricompacta TaxID=376703 RepID=A0AAD4QNK4_9AGAM|nr:programmed cell death protein 2 [Multifurca ochricompacta]
MASSGSESDEDDFAQIETSVLLGVPDGVIKSPSDLKDAAVSRIGGLPALLSHKVPFDSSYCQNCMSPMELLVQLWAPFEDSPYDRVLFVWACAKSACQRKSGSVRAWRGLRFNKKYASKLERKLTEHEREQSARSQGHKSVHQDVNPFAVLAPLDSPGAIPSQVSVPEEESTECDEDDASSSSSVSSLVVALASATLSDTSWQFAPSYPPQYLSTISEYIPPSEKSPLDRAARAEADGDGADQGSHPWASEKYEKSMHTDHVFDRFNERTAYEAQQCVRYDLHGIPIPFASDDLYKQLFSLSLEESGSTTVTKAVFNVQQPLPFRGYNATSLPSCPHCGSRRIFECQLMPNLINMVGRSSNTEGDEIATDEQRKEVVRKLLKGEPDGRGMEWGTILVFSCEKDCCLGPGNEEKQDAWSEELVLVHWDN